jgi:hypothetical protein
MTTLPPAPVVTGSELMVMEVVAFKYASPPMDWMRMSLPAPVTFTLNELTDVTMKLSHVNCSEPLTLVNCTPSVEDRNLSTSDAKELMSPALTIEPMRSTSVPIGHSRM